MFLELVVPVKVEVGMYGCYGERRGRIEGNLSIRLRSSYMKLSVRQW